MSNAYEFPTDSVHALGHIECEKVEDCAKLEGAITYWAERLDNAKRERALQWFTNHSFHVGNHYNVWYWHGTSLNVNNPHISNNRHDRFIPRIVENTLTRPYEVNVSLLTQEKPEVRVEPNTTVLADEDAAVMSEITLNLLWERPLNMPEKLREVAGILCLQGTAAIEVEYGETDQPERFPILRTEMQEDSLTGEEIPVEVETGEEGIRWKRDLRARVYNAFQIQADPAATDDPDSMTWIMRTTFEDITWIKRMFDRDEQGYFPENLDRILPNSGIGLTSPLAYWERVKDLLDAPYQTWAYTTHSNLGLVSGYAPNQTIMKVIDVKPNEDYPEGRTLILAGGALIYAGPGRAWSEKYPWRWHPYTIFRFWRAPGRFWGTPLFSMLVPLQKKINQIDMALQINREYLNIGQWLIPRQAQIRDQTFSGTPGEHFTYNAAGGVKPEKVPHQPLPGDVYNERNAWKDAIEIISGTNKLLTGATQSQHRSLGVIQQLQRIAQQSKSAMLQEFQNSLEKVGQNILIEVNLRMDEPDEELINRVQVAAREHSSATVRNFADLNLRDNVHVKIDIMSGIYRGPEAEAEAAQVFMQYAQGNMSGQERALIAKKMGIDGLDKTVSPQYRRARRMVQMVDSGVGDTFLPLEGIHNPAIFYEVLVNEMLKDTYDERPREQKEQLLALLAFYEAQLQKIQEQQAALQQQQSGEPTQ